MKRGISLRLSRQELLNQSPGPEFDQCINQSLMEVPRLYAYTHEKDGTYYPDPTNEEIAIREKALSRETPQYSTDICAAWEVVEELNSRGWPFQLSLDGKGHIEIASGPKGDYHAEYQENTSVPEAICKTALLAMMEVEEGIRD